MTRGEVTSQIITVRKVLSHQNSLSALYIVFSGVLLDKRDTMNSKEKESDLEPQRSFPFFVTILCTASFITVAL